jgi:hypothetical protein
MKKLLLISVLFGLMPLSMAAQVDDLYFVPKKKSATKVTDNYGLPREVYYSGSDRSVDEYNRRVSHYDLIAKDSTLNDTIHFSAEKGVYPDSTLNEDFEITRKMSRFDDYRIADNEAFWAGYEAGRYDWGWHSPWYYTRFGWYDPWYYPWYWNDPWYYSGYYGWYGGWYGFGYYPFYSSWYGPWYYDRFYYYGGGYVGRVHSAPTIGGGTIRRDGLSYGRHQSSSIARNSSRMSEVRRRTMSGHTGYSQSNASRSNSVRSGRSQNSTIYNTPRSSSNNSGGFGGSRSSGSFSSGGGSFGGGSRSTGGGGGGGGRVGGRR